MGYTSPRFLKSTLFYEKNQEHSSFNYEEPPQKLVLSLYYKKCYDSGKERRTADC